MEEAHGGGTYLEDPGGRGEAGEGPDDEPALVGRLIRLAREFGRYGYRQITALLRLEGWRANYKRVGRIWRQEGLKVPAARRATEPGDLLLGDRGEGADRTMAAGVHSREAAQLAGLPPSRARGEPDGGLPPASWSS